MLVLELDLRSFVKRTPLADLQVERVGAQVASALAFLHQVIGLGQRAGARIPSLTT